MIFTKEPFEKVGDKYKIPCLGTENGFAFVDLIMNEDSAQFTDNINVMDGAFTIVDHDTDKERTVYPFNNFGQWVWAESANDVNKFVSEEIKKSAKYFKGGKLKEFTKIGNDGKLTFLENEFFRNAEKVAMNEPIFNVGSFNEFISFKKNNPLEKIPEAIVGSAFALWLKYHVYDKDVDSFVNIMLKW